METISNTTATQEMSQNLYRFHIGLAIAGILTAIICSLTLLYDSYTSGRGFGKISSPIEITTAAPAEIAFDLKEITAVAIEQLK